MATKKKTLDFPKKKEVLFDIHPTTDRGTVAFKTPATVKAVTVSIGEDGQIKLVFSE